jgi:hypothetical protein
VLALLLAMPSDFLNLDVNIGVGNPFSSEHDQMDANLISCGQVDSSQDHDILGVDTDNADVLSDVPLAQE